MTKQEFIDRVPSMSTIDQEQFDRINAIYMELDWMDKNDFCMYFRNDDYMPIMLELVKQSQAHFRRIRQMNDKISDAADVLIDMYAKCSDINMSNAAEDARDAAIKLIGEKEFICRMIEAGNDLLKEDRDLAIKLLS